MLALRSWFGVALLGAALFGCSDDGGEATAERWLLSPETALPSQLSDVGLYEDLVEREAYDDIIPYEPTHVLYSNGLEKERHLYLPEGTEIDVRGSEAWVFPVGTVISKTFLFDDTPVETRLIFRREDRWDYAIYRWVPDATNAELLEGNWAEVSVPLDDEQFVHTLPSRLDCRTCHETHEDVSSTPVLGIGRLQSSDALAATGVFSEPPELEEVEGRSAEETAAFSYFVGNCISCHNGGESLNSSFSLYPDDAVANTVDRPTESETGEGIRVVPGEPEQSVLFVTVVEAGQPDYRGPFKLMPPIGVNVTDPEADGVLAAWIESL